MSQVRAVTIQPGGAHTRRLGGVRPAEIEVSHTGVTQVLSFVL